MSLREITIRNFAIIKSLEIEIDDGLTVVTGETGAGKSIMLDALNLLLGSRAESDMIRHGEERCEISALFDISRLNAVNLWLDQRDLASVNTDQEPSHCLIRRVLRNSKPTKCYINDQPTTLASLKELGLLLVDLHGQHEHQSLLRRPMQRQIIDQFADHADDLAVMATLASKIHRLSKELANITEGNTDNADRMELLSFQLNELDEANIVDGEFEQLAQTQSRLSNAQELLLGIESSLDGLFHNEASNVSSDLGNQLNRLNKLAEFDESLSPATELLSSALAQIEDAQGALDTSFARIEQNPERLAETEQRIDTLINLARKHRCSEAMLGERHQTLQTEYQRLEQQYAKPEKLQIEIAELTDKYQLVAQEVSDKRIDVAQRLSKEITAQMQDLGMQGGSLEIQVEAQIADKLLVSEHGLDTINYMVSTNHGMPLKPLQKTASGGELSRISLAIQVITSQQSNTPSLVFDEVDVGVGGKVAGIVGDRLKQLGKHAQVICITHLPQVASKGDQHLAVDKITGSDETYSTLVKLSPELRIEEIARMLGGTEITDRTRAHAEEMLTPPKPARKRAS